MLKKRLRDIKTVAKLKKLDNAKEFEIFETERFFKDKKLRLIETIGLKPLKVLVEIEEDNTEYELFKDGNMPDNSGKLLQITLDSKKEVKPGQIMQEGNAYVTFDYNNTVVKIVAQKQVFLLTKSITLSSSEQENLKEIYSAEEVV